MTKKCVRLALKESKMYPPSGMSLPYLNSRSRSSFYSALPSEDVLLLSL